VSPFVVAVRLAGPGVDAVFEGDIVEALAGTDGAQGCARADAPEGWDCELRVGVERDGPVDAVCFVALVLRARLRGMVVAPERVALAVR
jgi:hypothetical protein